MKALEILKDMLEEVHTDEQGYSYKDEVIMYAIAELEALLAPKTCELEEKALKLIKILDEMLDMYPDDVFDLCLKHGYYKMEDKQ